MGELIHIFEFSDSQDAFRNQTRFATRRMNWYFPEEVMVRDEKTYNRSLDWHQTILLAYPEVVTIHQDHFDGEDEREEKIKDRSLRMRLRRHVRDNCAGDVIYRVVEMDYQYLHRYVGHDGRKSAYRTTIKHGYYYFYFETAADAVAFALVFPQSEVSNRHPTAYRDVPEEEIADAAANPHGIYEEHRW